MNPFLSFINNLRQYMAFPNAAVLYNVLSKAARFDFFTQKGHEIWMALNVRRIETLKSAAKEQRFLDGKGLYLCLTPAGKKYWRVRYWLNSKASMISLGQYPEVSLKKAREANLEIKQLLDKGIHPSQYKENQNTPEALAPCTFEKAAREWAQVQKVMPQTHRVYIQRLEANVFPLIGDKPVEFITEQDILTVLMPIHARGAGHS